MRKEKDDLEKKGARQRVRRCEPPKRSAQNPIPILPAIPFPFVIPYPIANPIANPNANPIANTNTIPIANTIPITTPIANTIPSPIRPEDLMAQNSQQTLELYSQWMLRANELFWEHVGPEVRQWFPHDMIAAIPLNPSSDGGSSSNTVITAELSSMTPP
jgi:hypothetical protein